MNMACDQARGGRLPPGAPVNDSQQQFLCAWFVVMAATPMMIGMPIIGADYRTIVFDPDGPPKDLSRELLEIGTDGDNWSKTVGWF